LGAVAKCAPPLREAGDVERLRSQFRFGGIEFVASDHSPAPPLMKLADDFFEVWGGIAGVQSTLATMLSLFPEPSPHWLPAVAAYTATLVADRFAVVGKGVIRPRADADLSLVDVGAQYTLTRDMLLDRHKLSPYVGRTFRGVVRRTFVRGHTVFQDGRTVGDFRGRLVTPDRKGAARA
jgi:allantoinase